MSNAETLLNQLSNNEQSAAYRELKALLGLDLQETDNLTKKNFLSMISAYLIQLELLKVQHIDIRPQLTSKEDKTKNNVQDWMVSTAQQTADNHQLVDSAKPKPAEIQALQAALNKVYGEIKQLNQELGTAIEERLAVQEAIDQVDQQIAGLRPEENAQTPQVANPVDFQEENNATYQTIPTFSPVYYSPSQAQTYQVYQTKRVELVSKAKQAEEKITHTVSKTQEASQTASKYQQNLRGAGVVVNTDNAQQIGKENIYMLLKLVKLSYSDNQSKAKLNNVLENLLGLYGVKSDNQQEAPRSYSFN